MSSFRRDYRRFRKDRQFFFSSSADSSKILSQAKLKDANGEKWQQSETEVKV